MSHSTLSQIEVSNMMQGNNKIILLHADKHYLLSITRRGKLILTSAVETTKKQNTKSVINSKEK